MKRRLTGLSRSQLCQLIRIIPDNPDETDYAATAQRSLVAAAIEAVHKKSCGNWNFAHLLAAIQPSAIESVLSTYTSTRETYREYVGRYAPEHTKQLLGLLQSKLQPLYPAAAAWRYAGKHIGIREWADSHDVLILGNDEDHRDLLAPLNRVLASLAIDVLLSNASPSSIKTCVLLPSIKCAGYVEALPSLLTEGIGTGVSVYVGMSDLRPMHEHYGHEAVQMLESCGNFAFLRITETATATWASEKTGIQRVIVLDDNQERRIRRPAVSPSELGSLPLSDSTHALVAYLKNQDTPFYKAELRHETLHNKKLCPTPDIDCPAFLPCPESHCRFPGDCKSLLREVGFNFPEIVNAAAAEQPPRLSGQQAIPMAAEAAPSSVPAPRDCDRSQPATPMPTMQQPQNTKVFNPDDFPRFDLDS